MIIKSATFTLGAVSLSGMPDDGMSEVAFAGRSNVGKSSLINMLVGRKKLARTSGTPGKTQEVNFFRINDAFYIVDLPGFGYARVSRSQRVKWQATIGQYVTGRETLRLVFQLVDSRHPPTSLDREVMLLLMQSPASHVILLTKADKLSGNSRDKSIRNVRKVLDEIHLDVPVILTSAKTRRGRDEVYDWIETLMT